MVTSTSKLVSHNTKVFVHCELDTRHCFIVLVRICFWASGKVVMNSDESVGAGDSVYKIGDSKWWTGDFCC